MTWGKEGSGWTLGPWVLMLVITGGVALGQLFQISGTQFSHLWNVRDGMSVHRAPDCSVRLTLLSSFCAPSLFFFPLPFLSLFRLRVSHSLTFFRVKTLNVKIPNNSKFQPNYKTIYYYWNKLLEVKGSIASGMACSGLSISLQFSLAW